MTSRNSWLTLPLVLLSLGCGTVRPMCVYEPTTCPKSLEEPAGDEARVGGDPPTPNAFASLAGNRFTWEDWHSGPRIYCPLRSDAPTPNAFAPLAGNRFTSWTVSRIEVKSTDPLLSNMMIPPLPIWEKLDQPVAAAFYSFSGSNVAPTISPNVICVIRDFSLLGGGPMTGLTISLIATAPVTTRPDWAEMLHQCGATPVTTNLRKPDAAP